MRGVKHITSGATLLAALWFCLTASAVGAAGDNGHAAAESTGQILLADATSAEHGAKAEMGEHPVVGDVTHPVEEHGAEGDHGDAHGGSLSSEKLWDLFFRILNFAVLVFLLVKFGAKPIASGLSGRQQKIKDDIEDLEARKGEAEKSYRQFEEKLAGMEQEIDTIVDKAVAQAEIEKAKILEKAEQAAEDMKRQAEMTIANEFMVARRKLKDDIANQAAAMAEELIVANLKPEDQVKIIEDYLDKVEAVQ